MKRFRNSVIAIVVVLLLVAFVATQVGPNLLETVRGTGTREFRGMVVKISKDEDQNTTLLGVHILSDMSSRAFHWLQQSGVETHTVTICGEVVSRETYFQLRGLTDLDPGETVDVRVTRDIRPSLTRVSVFTMTNRGLVWVEIINDPPWAK